MSKPILVVGSLNMDFVVTVKSLPLPGETVLGHDFKMLPGGKGANQACAVGRLGGKGRMIGRVGADVFGECLVASLAESGVDTSGVLFSENMPTGVAMIQVQLGGQNQIIVASGANGQLKPCDIEKPIGEAAGGYLLLQLESPLETVEVAASIGRRHGILTVLDPAPARSVGSSLLEHIDLLTPNESEALQLLGRRSCTITLEEAPEVCRQLLELGPKSVILKLGAKGAWLAEGSRSQHFPGRQVEAVDTTAAGDVFNGALAVAHADGGSMEDAILFANLAASVSVTRFGAQASIPWRREIEPLLAQGCKRGS